MMLIAAVGCSSNGPRIKDQRDNDSDGSGHARDNRPNDCRLSRLDADGDGTGDVCDSTPAWGGAGQAQCRGSTRDVLSLIFGLV